MTDDRRPTTDMRNPTPNAQHHTRSRALPLRGGGVGGGATCIIVLLFATMMLSACAGGPTSYVHPTYDFSLIQKVAVLPLENHAGDPQAGEKVRKMVVSEILAGGVVDVVDPGQVNRALVQGRIENITRISAEEFKKLGESLGVQTFILGSVDTYERNNVGGSFFAEVGISLRAVDAATGSIIWSVTSREGGVSTTGRLFGFGGDTLSEATEKAVRSAVITLF
jgi:hypothetical protein